MPLRTKVAAFAGFIVPEPELDGIATNRISRKSPAFRFWQPAISGFAKEPTTAGSGRPFGLTPAQPIFFPGLLGPNGSTASR